MTTILILVAVAAISAVLYQMYLFDRLVRWEYEHQREQWERDGKPDGYFWRPKERLFWSSDAAKKQVGFTWLLKTPDWIAERSECRCWLRQMRAIALISFVAVAGVVSRLLLRVLLR